MKVHRTSSSRKARRKNEDVDWASHPHPLSVPPPPNTLHPRSLWRQFKSFALPRLPHPFVFLLAVAVAAMAYVHLATTFQYTTRFDVLSAVERQVSLPTSVAHSYGFFKRIAMADTYTEGLRAVTRDENAGAANSFQRHSLAPQALLAGGYHLLRRLSGVTGRGWGECRKVRRVSWTEGGGKLSWEGGEDALSTEEESRWEESRPSSPSPGSSDLFDVSCSGLGDPLNFYLTAMRLLECGALALVCYLGLHLSGSVMGGLMAPALALLLHPQGGDYSWLFPVAGKVGWLAGILELSVVCRCVLLPTHPSWRSTVKVGLCTLGLILCWNKEAQWLLASQLLILTVTHIFGLLSRYRASLVIFGQLAGWQWASLVSLDVSLQHWSLWVYCVLACVLTLVVVEPLVDWVIGRRKRERWAFFRRTLLLITLQTLLIAVRFDLAHHAYLHEDSRFPLSPSNCHLQQSKDVAPPSSCTPSSHPLGALPVDGLEKREDEKVKKFLGGAPEREELRMNKSGGESFDLAHARALELKRMRMERVSGFVRECFGCGGRLTPREALRKHGWAVLAALYSVTAVLFLPIIVSSFPKADPTDEGEGAERKEPKWWKQWGLLLVGTREERVEGWEGCVVYWMVQTGVSGALCICVDGGWELLFTTQLAVLISLQGNFQVTWRQLEELPFRLAKHLHWLLLPLLLSAIVASSISQTNNMRHASRGRFEVGNPRVGGVVNALRWITSHARGSTFAGPDNLMATLSLVLAPNVTTVNPHITLHSWTNHNPVSAKKNSSLLWRGRDERRTSLFTEEEARAMVATYSLFSRSMPLPKLHQQLIDLNVTHLLLTPQMCPPPLPLSKAQNVPSKWTKNLKNRDFSEDGAAFLGEEGGKKKKVVVQEMGGEGQEGERKGGQWQWEEHWQTPSPAPNHHPRRCDFLAFWTALEREERWAERCCEEANNDKEAWVGGASEEEMDFYEETVCNRLLGEGNLRPFHLSYSNSFVSIFSLHPPPSPPPESVPSTPSLRRSERRWRR